MNSVEQRDLQERTKLRQCQWSITYGQRQCVPQGRTRDSEVLCPYLVVLERGTARSCRVANGLTDADRPIDVMHLGEVAWCCLICSLYTLVDRNTFYTRFAAERAANAVDLKGQRWCGRTSAHAVWSMPGVE